MLGTIEKWKKVVGHEDTYSVSNYGKVRRDKAYRSTYTGRLLKCSKNMSGYPVVKIYAQGIFKIRKVHQLVMEAFVGPCTFGNQVNHIDGVKTNNCINNLEYVTASKNIQHSYALGLTKPSCGENHVRAKLKEEQVIYIKERLLMGSTYKELAQKFNVNRTTIYDIDMGKTWNTV